LLMWYISHFLICICWTIFCILGINSTGSCKIEFLRYWYVG
jgi:hypothetical protein